MKVRVKFGFADSELISLTGQYPCAVEDKPWIPVKAIEPPTFLIGVANRKTPWSGLLASLLIHALCLVVGFPLAQLLNYSENQPPDTVHISKPPLRIVLPEHIYYARVTPPAKANKARPPAQAQPVRQARTSAAAPAIASPEPQAPAGRERRPAKQFRLADLPKTVASEQTLLQPEFDPKITPREVAKIPTMLLWSPKPVKPPAPKPFVMPGRTTEAAPPPVLDAPPRLQLPRETLTHVALPMPAALPVQLDFPPKPEISMGPASTDPTRGDPTQLLSISNAELPKSDKPIAVPDGNQVSRNLTSSSQSGDGAIATPGGDGELNQAGGNGQSSARGTTGGTGGTGTGTVGGTGTAGTTGTIGGTGAGATGGTGGSAAGSSTAQTQGSHTARSTSSAPSAAPAGSAPKATAPGAARPVPEPLKTVHPPGGNFDIMLIQSSLAQAFPESGGMLTGRPIYTVYLPVGGSKEWMMQYCVPHESAQTPVARGSVIQLGNPKAVTAPYPQVTYAPEKQITSTDKHVLVHGLINTAGQFQDLQMVGSAALASEIIPLLGSWKFRPATRDGKPVQVEILLEIPAKQP